MQKIVFTLTFEAVNSFAFLYLAELLKNHRPVRAVCHLSLFLSGYANFKMKDSSCPIFPFRMTYGSKLSSIFTTCTRCSRSDATSGTVFVSHL